MMRTLLIKAITLGVTIQSDGAMITHVPLLNVLAYTNNPFALLEIVDCTNQMAKRGKKDAEYLCSVIRSFIWQLEDLANVRKKGPKPSIVDLVMFDGTSNAQLCGRLLAKYHPHITVCHRACLMALAMPSYVANSLPKIIHTLQCVTGRSMLSLFSSPILHHGMKWFLLISFYCFVVHFHKRSTFQESTSIL